MDDPPSDPWRVTGCQRGATGSSAATAHGAHGLWCCRWTSCFSPWANSWRRKLGKLRSISGEPNEPSDICGIILIFQSKSDVVQVPVGETGKSLKNKMPVASQENFGLKMFKGSKTQDLNLRILWMTYHQLVPWPGASTRIRWYLHPFSRGFQGLQRQGTQLSQFERWWSSPGEMGQGHPRTSKDIQGHPRTMTGERIWDLGLRFQKAFKREHLWLWEISAEITVDTVDILVLQLYISISVHMHIHIIHIHLHLRSTCT